MGYLICALFGHNFDFGTWIQPDGLAKFGMYCKRCGKKEPHKELDQ